MEDGADAALLSRYHMTSKYCRPAAVKVQAMSVKGDPMGRSKPTATELESHDGKSSKLRGRAVESARKDSGENVNWLRIIGDERKIDVPSGGGQRRQRTVEKAFKNNGEQQTTTNTTGYAQAA